MSSKPTRNKDASLSTSLLVADAAGTPAIARGEPAVYAMRWYILSVFVVFCVMQNAMWNFYSPIMGTVQTVYSWSSYFVSWLGNTANITFCVLVIPVSVFVDLYGMRRSVLITIAALNLNAGLRLIPVTGKGYEGASLASMLFNGVAGTVETLSPPVLSFLWFPVGERATATAIMASANTAGTAVGFLTALIVPATGSTGAILASLNHVYWAYFAICAVTLVAVVAYFPDAPPTPPSHSHSVPKVAVGKGILELLVHGRFWVVAISLAVPLGVLSAWMNVLGNNLAQFGVSQDDVGWIGFSLAVGGTLGGVVSGRVCDYFPGHMTRVLAGLYGAATVLIALFICILEGVIPCNTGALIALAGAIGFVMYGTYPVFFELAIETTFPVSDAATAGFLVMAQAVIQSIFLAIPTNVVGTAWMNWTLLAAPAACMGALLFFKERYARLHLDLGQADTEAEGLAAGTASSAPPLDPEDEMHTRLMTADPPVASYGGSSSLN